MTGPSFFWHDYETFGVRPRRDRPAQFAGVRTDFDLNVIAEPVMWHCQPPRDTLPEPEACWLTGITPQICAERGLSERDFAAAIEHELALPGTVGCGYNSLRFDDEVTRHLFWRNLIDPYSREWRNDCARWDLMDALRCAWALRPEGVVWPVNEDGKASFKLEHLSAANGIAHADAHDALADVRVTLALARVLKSAQPKLWDFCLGLRSKNTVKAQMLPGHAFLHISGRYPVERGCTAIVWPLAPHPTDSNGVIVWDLAADPNELLDLNAEQIRARLFTATRDLPDGVSRLPLKVIRINRSPIVIAKISTLSDERAAHWGIDKVVAQRHAQTAGEHGERMAGVWPDVFTRERVESDVDEDLYGGFVPNDDRRVLERLRGMTPAQLAEQRPAFSDERLEELLFRYRARNFPELLSDDERQRWRAHAKSRLVDGVGGLQTLAVFRARVTALAAAEPARRPEMAGALLAWADELESGLA